MATEKEVSDYMRREAEKAERWEIERARIKLVIENAGFVVNEFETNTVGAIKDLRVEYPNRVMTLDRREGYMTTTGRKPDVWNVIEWLRDGERLGIMGASYEYLTDEALLEGLAKAKLNDENGVRFESYFIGGWILLEPSKDGKWRVYDTLEDEEVFSDEENAGYRRSYERNLAEAAKVLEFFSDDEVLEINIERSGTGGGGDHLELCPDPKKWITDFREKMKERGDGYLDMLDTPTPMAAFGVKDELLDAVALIRVGDYREALANRTKMTNDYAFIDPEVLEKYWVIGTDDEEDSE